MPLKHTNPYADATLAVGLVTFALSMVQLIYLTRIHFLRSQKFLLKTCIIASGFAAVANGLAASLNYQSYVFYMDLLTVFRCIWVYSYIMIMLSLFEWRGGGGRNELLKAAGETLERANLPVMKYPPPFTIFTCACSYKPGTAFVNSAVSRVERYIAVNLLIVVIQQTLYNEGLLYTDSAGAVAGACPEHKYATVSALLTAGNLCSVFLGLSGILALTKVLEPIITPTRRDVVTFRHRMYLFIQTIWPLQDVLVFGVIVPKVLGTCDARDERGLVIAIELLLFQICTHRGFIPFFRWQRPSKGVPLDLDTIASNLAEAKFTFLVPIEEMVAQFPKEKAAADEKATTAAPAGGAGEGGATSSPVTVAPTATEVSNALLTTEGKGQV